MNKSRENFFKEFFSSTQSRDNNNVSSISNANDDLIRALTRLKSNLDNDGIFYSCLPDTSMEVIKYDMTYLKETL
ncbi:hypothetical protein [Borrelia miyamotoi]|uniref:DUF1073 domain-containing protein n=1 Tax=Borrelia miyamotoi TaxID=47466 RepID=A0AAQ3AHE4_9SPIR|nr:hypothetical protein [Borrelia miyamotoi]QTL83971.1 hypothetical protein bmLB2001_001227 [Borrelia miyamotoi]WAZ85603.1 hypothetical protein O5400_04440 [Borrelia miyamotoi]WAZ91387.1 hypothetical protein O5398_04440 [Borrelia miyamotoi]WAZ92673.1 hypothetical protein O5402_04440 [Borrelia miyamotoi]WAZ93964.1 hypothetical protein O5399_04445 [Borrelia miyamotoi]